MLKKQKNRRMGLSNFIKLPTKQGKVEFVFEETNIAREVEQTPDVPRTYINILIHKISCILINAFCTTGNIVDAFEQPYDDRNGLVHTFGNYVHNIGIFYIIFFFI